MNAQLAANKFEQAIIKTLAYFDIFEYPLTLLELNQFLLVEDGSKKTNLGEVFETYRQSEKLQQLIDYKNGFFFLRGKESLIRLRQQRYNLADRKFKAVKRALRCFAKAPGVRSIIICNSLSFLNSTDNSDIDLFVITRPRMIWISRMLLILISELFGVRIHGEEVKDKVCLSFFTTSDNYDFSKIAIENDVYLKYWVAGLIPVFGGEEFNRFFEANAKLLSDLPNLLPKRLASRRKIFSSNRMASVFWPLFRALDPWAKKFQLSRLAPYKIALAQSEGAEVILTDRMLKFHDNDRRWIYKQLFLEKCRELGLD